MLVLADIYAAGETPREDVSSAILHEAIKQHGQRQTYHLPDLIEQPGSLLTLLEPGDLVLTLGAGSIGRLGEDLLFLLSGREQ